MSLTYSHETPSPHSLAERDAAADHTPVYARSRRRKAGVPAWMILAPIGVLTLGGLAALALTANTPSAEDAAVAPAPAPTMIEAPLAPVTADPVLVAEAPILAAPTVAAAAAPVARQSSPAARSTPVRRAATPAQAAPAQAASVVVAVPAEPTGPRPYVAPATPTAAVTTPAPIPAPIVVVPPVE